MWDSTAAHRGAHQTYDRENLGLQDCTATRIDTPMHDLLENTLASMRAAFEAGADKVPIGFNGYIWTDKIEDISPLVNGTD